MFVLLSAISNCLNIAEEVRSNSIFKVELISKTHESLCLASSTSSSLFKFSRKSPNVSESSFFDICFSKNQSAYCNTHLSIGYFGILDKRRGNLTMFSKALSFTKCKITCINACFQKQHISSLSSRLLTAPKSN